MSTIQRVSGGITKARGYPGLRATINGVPSTDLQSLLWFESGTLDAAHPGPYTNSVPGGASPTLYRGGSPTKRSYGLETNADGNGIVIDTLIPFTRNFTVIACMKSTVAPATQWIGWCAPTAHSFPASAASSFPNTNSPWPTLRVHGEGTTPSGNGHTILDMSATEVPAGTNPILRPEVAPADEATVVAYRCTASIASASGRLELIALPTTLSIPEGYGVASPNAASVINAALLNWFAAYEAASTFMLGAWPFGTQRPCTAQIYAFAVYNVLLSDDILFEAMKAISRRVVARGVPVTGGGSAPEDIP